MARVSKEEPVSYITQGSMKIISFYWYMEIHRKLTLVCRHYSPEEKVELKDIWKTQSLMLRNQEFLAQMRHNQDGTRVAINALG